MHTCIFHSNVDMTSKRKQSTQIIEDLEVEEEDTVAASEDDFDLLEEAGDLLTDLRDQPRASRSSERTSSLSEDSDTTNADYESVSSPGGSSTASGPTYIRPAGFEHHAQEVLASKASTSTTASNSVPRSLLSRHSLSSASSVSAASPIKSGGVKKKKGLLNADFKDVGVTSRRIEGVAVVGSTSSSTRSKSRKEPMPMKQRALPQSFWQQPNVANPQSPSKAFANLPGLSLDDFPPVEEVSPVSNVVVKEDEGRPPGRRTSTVSIGSNSNNDRVIISQANTDLLFSLFNSVEEEEAQRRIHVVRRGRPKKTTNTSAFHRVARDDDPCLSTTSAESILPLIPDRGVSGTSSSGSSAAGSSGASGSANKASQGTQIIKIMSISHGDRSVELPSLNVEHNYPHLLSELVMKL